LGEGERSLSPNDDVNKSQSSNDTFPTAMHIACYDKLVNHTLNRSYGTKKYLSAKKLRISIGGKNRAHPPYGCYPLTLGQEFSGYVAQLSFGIKQPKTA
jgi:fumarate hydratase class II